MKVFEECLWLSNVTTNSSKFTAHHHHNIISSHTWVVDIMVDLLRSSSNTVDHLHINSSNTVDHLHSSSSSSMEDSPSSMDNLIRLWFLIHKETPTLTADMLDSNNHKEDMMYKVVLEVPDGHTSIKQRTFDVKT